MFQDRSQRNGPRYELRLSVRFTIISATKNTVPVLLIMRVYL